MYHKWKSYDVCFLRYEAWQTFLSFWAIFCSFTLLTTPTNQNFEKWNKNLDIKEEYQKLWSYAIPVLRYGWQTDGWTEKWHIEVGTLHCFSLKIYGFCSSNALYPESLPSISTRMFDTFDNWDHYYFESNFSLELLIKVFL